jgi:histidinol-phosphate aminotransferase
MPIAPRPGMIWLNANEFPTGPPAGVLAAMRAALEGSNRYHYEEFDAFFSTLSKSFDLRPENILVGAGSTEVLHCAVEAFAGPERPFVTAWPTFEAGAELADAKGFRTVKLPFRADHSCDVERLALEAMRAGGGLIYVCNPNNPTSSITAKNEMQWLVERLPSNTHLVVDEAYIDFTDSPRIESALRFVRDGANVIVLRTFSKIYGMAGVRVGFAAARRDLIARMTPYRNNVVSIMAARGVLAALEIGPGLIEHRRRALARTRATMTAWCAATNLAFIEPHANFVMLDIGRDSTEVRRALMQKGIALGRPFPPYDTMLRVTIGSDEHMAAFRTALMDVLGLEARRGRVQPGKRRLLSL